MNSLNKVSVPNLLLLGVLLGMGATGTAWAATTTAEAFEQCRLAAEVAYGSADENAEVRLDGVRKSGKQLRLKVFTPEGEQFNAFCTVNRKTGQLVSMDPPGRPAAGNDLASNR